jgi:HTH-type transcriptional regulator / antitoxin HigA
MSTVLANPAEMIAHGAPRVIHNDAELEMSGFGGAIYH